MIDSVCIDLLGRFEVRRGDATVPIPSAGQRALLAVLALDAGRMASTEHLIECVWGDSAPGASRNALQHHVSRLRRLIGPAVLTHTSGYRLDLPREAVDAVRFESLAGAGRAALRAGRARDAVTHLRDAVALWRSAPLTEFADHAWAQLAAAHLQERYLAAVEDRFDAELAVGEHVDVVENVRSVVAEHPFRERLWGQLMLALYRSGRQPEALAAYAEARRLLADEHGLDPGPALIGLEQAILNQEPGLAAPPAPSAQRRAGSIPTPLTSFVGRRRQVSTVAGVLRDNRLVTLIGPPGVGKTRLAIEVGRSVGPRYPDGVWFVELAALADGHAVADAVTSMIGVRRSDDVGASSAEGLARQLADWQGLLVLDNCEHLVAGVAELVTTLLGRCPEVSVLATSRETLNLPGEARWPVPPLGVPAPAAEPDRASDAEAVRLFVDRAARARPSFTLGPDLAAVADLCRQLDGLPLAIELAAARVPVLPVGHIAAALDDRFRLLVAGDRTSPPRQRSLRAAISWSYELLTLPERAVFEHLSVFAGGCPLAAAESVGAMLGFDRFAVLDLLGDLVDKSLVSASVGVEGEPRYDMLETLRAYGVEQLSVRGELEQARRRHAGVFAAAVRRIAARLQGPEHAPALARAEEELENLRAAMRTALACGEAEIVVDIAGTLGFFFAMTDRHAEGRGWLESGLAHADESMPLLTRARALTNVGYLAGQQGDMEHGIADAERGLALATASGNVFQTASSGAALALTLAAARRHHRVPALLAAARAGFDAIGDQRADWGVAVCEIVAAVTAIREGDPDGVVRANHELLARVQHNGYRLFETWSRLLAAWSAERRADLTAAAAECRLALDLVRPLGLPHQVAFVLTQLGRVEMRAGAFDRARAAQRAAVEVVDAAASPWFAAYADHGLGMTLLREGAADAVKLFTRSIAECPPLGSTFARELFFHACGGSPVAGSLAGLGIHARQHGDLAEAERLHCDGMAKAEEEADAAARALGLEGLAAVAAYTGRPERAALLLGAAETVRKAAWCPRDRFEADDAAATAAHIDAAIGPEPLHRLLKRGRSAPANTLADIRRRPDRSTA